MRFYNNQDMYNKNASKLSYETQSVFQMNHTKQSKSKYIQRWILTKNVIILNVELKSN